MVFFSKKAQLCSTVPGTRIPSALGTIFSPSNILFYREILGSFGYTKEALLSANCFSAFCLFLSFRFADSNRVLIFCSLLFLTPFLYTAAPPR